MMQKIDREVSRVMKSIIYLKNRFLVNIGGQWRCLSVIATEKIKSYQAEVKFKVRYFVRQFLATGGVAAT